LGGRPAPPEPWSSGRSSIIGPKAGLLTSSGSTCARCRVGPPGRPARSNLFPCDRRASSAALCAACAPI
jgi:hypothetical protein